MTRIMWLSLNNKNFIFWVWELIRLTLKSTDTGFRSVFSTWVKTTTIEKFEEKSREIMVHKNQSKDCSNVLTFNVECHSDTMVYEVGCKSRRNKFQTRARPGKSYGGKISKNL